jgi:glycosyltransferase involved in cell wall biosynthesis
VADRLKVVVVIGSLNRGGSERQVVELVRPPHPAGTEFAVVCLAEPGELQDEVRGGGVPIQTVGFVGFRPRSLLGPFRIAMALRRARPDVVYGFLFWGYGLALPIAAIVTPGALRIAARRSTPEGDAPRKVARPLRRLADRVAHGVVANSPEIAEEWLASTPTLRGRMHVIPNGVAVPDHPGRGSGEARPVIICVANLIAYKGHATLLEAAAMLKARAIGFQLRLVGDGPERLALEAATDRLGLRDHVEFMGRRDDVRDLLDVADIAVLPSHFEGLPNAVMEAMAAGVPVVATAVGGTSSLLARGGGLSVPPRDPGALADALGRLLTEPSARARCGAAGRKTIEDHYSLAAMREGTLRLFRDLRSARGRRR